MPRALALHRPHPVLVVLLLAALTALTVALIRMGVPAHHVLGMAPHPTWYRT